ncbi:MAG: hypothetical protein KAZ26_20060 [Caldilineaceae bacterium]|nr:hypothetical protein [Caldilineaceae bacterium]
MTEIRDSFMSRYTGGDGVTYTVAGTPPSNALTRSISALRRYPSAVRYIATGYPIVCGHPIPGEIAQALTTLTLRATVKRAGSFRWLRFEAVCPDCGRRYSQETDKVTV